ncbi:MAG: ATP-binding protein [Hyphomonadaceae bacterium]
MPEFHAQALDALRQPIESGEAVIARANRHVRYPARFQLVAAMNPCRCGGGAAEMNCRIKPACQQKYQSRISGPFMDRIDLFFDTPPVTAIDLALPAPVEGTAECAARVLKARDIQTARFETETLGTRRALNADAGPPQLDKCAQPDGAGAALLADAAVKLNLTARGYHRVLKVARTIADLDGADTIARLHIAEALTYRKRSQGEATIKAASEMVF